MLLNELSLEEIIDDLAYTYDGIDLCECDDMCDAMLEEIEFAGDIQPSK